MFFFVWGGGGGGWGGSNPLWGWGEQKNGEGVCGFANKLGVVFFSSFLCWFCWGGFLVFFFCWGGGGVRIVSLIESHPPGENNITEKKKRGKSHRPKGELEINT